MTSQDCKQLIDEYVAWLRSGISVQRLGQACELTTPFLDRHNDHLQVYVTKENGKFLLTDDGYILSDLRTSGVDLNTQKRKDILEATINGFGVRQQNGSLVTEASERTLGQRLHSLVQSMLAVNDMFVMAQHRVQGFFWEDVKSWLDASGVRYSSRVKLAGKSGYDHAVDFLIPRSQQRPERLLQAINAPTKNSVANYLFVLSDTKALREDPLEAFAFLNDRDRPIGGDILEALSAYDVKPALWSRREEFVGALVA